MKKREMFVFVSLDPPHASLDKGGMRACLEFLPFSGVGSTLPFPLIHPPIKRHVVILNLHPRRNRVFRVTSSLLSLF